MGVGRTAPHRVRAAYARALAAIPLPVSSVAVPAQEAMTVLGEAEVGDRLIQFGTMTSAPKLWVAFADNDGRIFGCLTGLLGGEPELHLLTQTGQADLRWAMRGDTAEAIRCHGLEVWYDARRWCEG